MPLPGVADPSTGVPVVVGVVVMVPVTVVDVTAVPVPDGVDVMLATAVFAAKGVLDCVGEGTEGGGDVIVIAGSKVAVSTRLGNVSVIEGADVAGSPAIVEGSVLMSANSDPVLARG